MALLEAVSYTHLDVYKRQILDYANASVDNNATMLALKAYAAEALTNNTSALHRTAAVSYTHLSNVIRSFKLM